MKNSIKGAIAAGGAAVILLGGAGSLAYWNSTDDIVGGTITSGNLVVDATACDTAGWTVTNTVEGVTQAPFVASEDIVPGDKLTKTCTVDIVAVGTNLRATLGTTGGAETGSLEADDYSVTSTFQISGANLTEITDADNGKQVDATIVLDFPIKSGLVDDSSKLKTLNIADFTITATQATTPAL